MGNLKKEIKNLLGNIVDEERANVIFKANFPEPITGYKAGKILTFKQIKELPEGSVIHILYFDEDGEERTDSFETLSKHSDEEFSAGSFPFPMDEHDSDDELIDKRYNSDWTFTIREAIKVSKKEFEKIEKQREKNRRASELLGKMQNEEPLTKEEKKELKKLVGIYIR